MQNIKNIAPDRTKLQGYGMRQLIFLHGNLQTSSVWAPLVKSLGMEALCVDLWESPADSMAEWAKQFIECVVAAQTKDTQPVLVGYSMGGRLAMQLLADSPRLWAGAILIGAHPGSPDASERQEWQKRDDAWAARFASDEPWDSIIADWDSLPVFCQVPNPCPPYEGNFDHLRVAQVQRAYSKGRQDYLLPRIQNTGIPVLYVSGEMDTAYSAMGDRITKSLPNSRQALVKGAGHRVPWEQPAAFCQILRDFVAALA